MADSTTVVSSDRPLRATKTRPGYDDFDGRLLPIRSPQSLTVVPDRVWTPADWAVIRSGFRSTDMDDRWHAVAENDRLFFYRSWTGNGIAVAQFAPRDAGWVITEVIVESDPERYRRGSDELEALHFVQLVEAILLGRYDRELNERITQLRRASTSDRGGDS